MMNKIKKYLRRVHSHTAKINAQTLTSILSRLLFPLIGLLSCVWMLVRVIPKPSRAGYPCIRAAMPLASGFILYMVGLVTSVCAIREAKKWFHKTRYLLTATFVILAIIGILWTIHSTHNPGLAQFETAIHQPNNPIGEAKGLFPGRVVWVHNPDATNENCIPNQYGSAWFMDENNDQNIIDKMLSDALQGISGQTSDSTAWDAVFKYHNNARGKGDIGYQEGEKVFIKTNATSSWWGNINSNDLSIVENQYYGISETSPHLVLSVLRQLVNIVGVAQGNIYVGDPMKHIYKHCYELWYSEFPDVHYLDHDGWVGREKVVESVSAIIYYSDRGTVLRTGTWDNAAVGDPVYNDYLYTIFDECDYMLNIPTLKGHKHAGVTMFAKNHFGSHTRDDAKHLHGGLVAPEVDNPRRQGYGLYRVQVDLLGHELLGGKNLLYIMDALWSSDFEIDPPDKFLMPPFNNDWMSSLFVSLDPIAIESVGFDFLRAEFTVQRGLATYPQMEGVDDYLHQAADSTLWADGIVYDPENDGTPLPSLGVHEHWNNPADKQYSRNLGTGNGIELVDINSPTSVKNLNTTARIADKFILHPNYPNPFNQSTQIPYQIHTAVKVELTIYNMQGQRVRTLVNAAHQTGAYLSSWNGTADDGSVVPSGMYMYQLRISGGEEKFIASHKMLFIK